MHPDLKEKFVLLEKNKAYYFKILDQYSPDQLIFSEGEGKWSILQLIDHLIKVESQTLQFMLNFDFSRKDEKLGLKASFNALLLRLALKSSIKFKVPAKVLLPQQKEKTFLVDEWDALRVKFENYLESFPTTKMDNFIFIHPSSGKLNIIQTLKFLKEHLAHHRAQIKRISKSKNFPTRAEN